MHFDIWFLFLLTSLGISLTPGPNSLLVLTHGALHGSCKTLWTIAGGLIAFTIIIAVCMFGIGALLRSSLGWLTALKLVGGAYLIFLGIKLWRSPPVAVSSDVTPRITSGWTLFRAGLLTGGTNPKSFLFFSALLPQFLDPHGDLLVQFLLIAATYALTEFSVEYGLAAMADRVKPWLARVGKKFNHICGGLFVAVGVALPLR